MQGTAAPDTGMLDEAFRRGLLPPDKRGMYEEALTRGLLKGPGAPAGGAAGGQTAPSAPTAPKTQTEAPAASASAPVAPAPSAQAPANQDVWAGMGQAPQKLREAQESFSSRAKQARGEMRIKEGYEPGVDYDTGTGFVDAVQMFRSDNPAEKRAFLENKYGKDKVFTDRRGEFYVETPEGKRVSPEGTGFVNHFIAGLYADAPIIAGATVGGVLGSPLGGVPGAIAGAGVGGTAGKASIEASKLLAGQQRQTLGEEVRGLAGGAAVGAAGEAGGRLVSGVPGAMGKGFRKYITGTTPEARELTNLVERAGGTAPLRSAAPGLSSPIQKQDISTRLGADWLEDPNRAAVHTRLGEILGASGMPEAERSVAMREILDPTARVSAREAGEPIVGAVQQHVAAGEAEIARLSTDADRMLSQQLSRLNAQSRRSPPGALGADVAGGIEQARTDFGTAMQTIYSRVDQIIGGQPVVPTARIKREATSILERLPKDPQGNPIFGDPRVLRALQQLQHLGEEATPNPALSRATLADAQRIRSTLGELGDFTDLTPGIAKRQFDQLRRSVDIAIGQAAQDPAAAPAVRLLRRADQAYSEGIRKFEDTTINQMVNQAKTGVLPDPGKVAETILQPQFTARAAEIKKMVPERTWRRVAAADWENVMVAARDPQTGEISAAKMAQAINARNRNGLLDLTYGPGIARDMRLYSQRLDARGGTIPATNLNADNFGQTMRELERAQGTQDRFLKQHFLATLSKPGPLTDDAVAFVARPGEEARLIEAQNFFGPRSQQMQSVQKQALKELLNSAIVTTETGAGTTIKGDAIEAALRKWTPRQQQILFPDGLADDMRLLAKEIRFMFPVKGDQIGGALISGFVKNLPLPARILPVIYYEGLSWIYSRPGVVRAIANGLRPGPTQAATREGVRMIFRAIAAGQLPQDQPTPDADVMSAPGAAAAQLQQEINRPPPAPQPTGRPVRKPSASNPNVVPAPGAP